MAQYKVHIYFLCRAVGQLALAWSLLIYVTNKCVANHYVGNFSTF